MKWENFKQNQEKSLLGQINPSHALRRVFESNRGHNHKKKLVSSKNC